MQQADHSAAKAKVSSGVFGMIFPPDDGTLELVKRGKKSLEVPGSMISERQPAVPITSIPTSPNRRDHIGPVLDRRLRVERIPNVTFVSDVPFGIIRNLDTIEDVMTKIRTGLDALSGLSARGSARATRKFSKPPLAFTDEPS